MIGDRIQWNPELVQTIDEMHKQGIHWNDIAIKLKFHSRGKVLSERFSAYLRHEKERENARIAKRFEEIQRQKPFRLLQLISQLFGK